MGKKLDFGKVYLVRGDHPFVPGEHVSLHPTRASANAEAADLVRIICKDLECPLPATVMDWPLALRAAQLHRAEVDEAEYETDLDDSRLLNDADFDVSVTEMPIVTVDRTIEVNRALGATP